MKFYDRVNELAVLDENEQQSYESAVFTVLTGRRRVGKTTLIAKAMEGKEYAYLFVSKDSEAMLCQKFQKDLQQQLGLSIYGAITCFKDLFEVIMKEAQKRHLTIVFDEFQNLYAIHPAIFSDIQNVWDRHKTNAKINLIVSGSVQTLMRRIFDDKAEPLYGRPTSKLTLLPFKIGVMKEIIYDVYPSCSSDDLLCLYAITGGVPKYIELLIDAKCFTKEKMIRYVCRQDSYFITEGRDMLNQEFRGEYGTYFSILQLIASGKTKRSEIDGALQRDVGTYLQILDEKYELISRIRPLLSSHNSKVTAYEIRDNFLRFWFRFVYPYLSIIERNQFSLLERNIIDNYEAFTGRTMERYFQDKVMESGQFTQVGNWWDRKGLNEIDLVAINEFNHKGIVAEVRRNPRKINMANLSEKISALPVKDFGGYTLEQMSFSLEDM